MNVILDSIPDPFLRDNILKQVLFDNSIRRSKLKKEKWFFKPVIQPPWIL